MRTIVSGLAIWALLWSPVDASEKIPRPLPETHRAIANLELGITSREELFRLLGPAQSWPRPDQHHDAFRYCYELRSTNPTWLVVGFGWMYSFEILNSVAVTNRKQDLKGPCVEARFNASEISTSGGLQLGISRDEVDSAIGDDPTSVGKILRYDYESYEEYPQPIRQPESDFLYVGEYHYGAIEITLEEESVARFFIWLGGEPEWKVVSSPNKALQRTP